MSTHTVVFIHGNFVSYTSWAAWVQRFEARGYKVITVPYPGRDKPVAELRREHPDPRLGQLTIEAVIDHHVRILSGLPEKPIVIGHSFGGLLTQLMVNRDLAAAAVAIDSVPPQGVLSTQFSFLKSTFPLLNPLTPPSRPYLMPFEHFQYTFANGMPLDEQRRLYDQVIVPESLRLIRGGLSARAHIDFKKPHAPLLLIGGETDNIMPAALNRVNAGRYKASSSRTDFVVFPGRNHIGIAAPGWEELADYALEWAVKAIRTETEAAPAGVLRPVPVTGPKE
ncbi:MAG: alpha/beta hydrolase [Chloroflexi bacterium]|nr:alpha/beta hydrolase [Chloroflexota bacterium]